MIKVKGTGMLFSHKLITCVYLLIRGIFAGFMEPRSIVLWNIFNVRISFIDIHQVRSKLAIAYTRDACNGDLCQVGGGLGIPTL